MEHTDEPGPHYSSSPGDLSDPPSGEISEPGSPSRMNLGRANIQMEDIMIGETPTPTFIEDGKRYAIIDGKRVQLTAAGVPRKKPGRKPGSATKPKATDDAEGTPKARKPRKPRESDVAPPIQRKRKIAPATNADVGADSKSLSAPQYDHEQSTMQAHVDESFQSSQKAPKRESIPSSMQSILNAEPDEQPLSAVRSSGQKYDPIRGNYDPVRETMSYRASMGTENTPYSTASASTNRANTSPSIASLVDPPAPSAGTASLPRTGTTIHQSHPSQVAESTPPSPAHPLRPASSLNLRPTPAPVAETRKQTPTSMPALEPATLPAHKTEPRVKESGDGLSTRKTATKQKANAPVVVSLANEDQTQAPTERSILDFGRATPGEEVQAPTIVLDIPLKGGETNKYINFMRLAEERYGWDALHPRQAANRDRKARIAAASAALEKAGPGSGRESGDEMSVDLSDVEGSNVEMGASGVDVQAKPARKKRNFKEDEYDIDDDFVDDSEMQWENQAAASRDGFFVYMGPLIREAEIPPVGAEGTGKRGRRGGGVGSRGGRGGAARGANGTGRGGGPGSRGGVVRRSRATKAEKAEKAEKAQREKVERESLQVSMAS